MQTLKADAAAGLSLDFQPPCGPYQVTTKTVSGKIISTVKCASRKTALQLYHKALYAQEHPHGARD